MSVERHPIKPVPYNAETVPAALAEPVTPTAAHYVRANFAVPVIAPDAYRLVVDGAVASPQALALAALRALPWHDVVVTMECAGNDRLGLRPLPAGEPWASGAVATARWGGVRLADVLALAGVAPAAREVVVAGADRGPRDDAGTPDDVPFARALPIEVAQGAAPLLALTMNGAPLPVAHGAPVRLVVPGWYGMAHVKWVTRLTLASESFAGYFQTRRYVYDTGDGVAPVTRARVKSLITAPAEGSRVPAGPLAVHGWAWSGDAPVTRVEVAIGGGDAWQQATLGVADGPFAWTPWTCTVEPPHPGRLVLRSRATDASGARQPDVIVWNRLGYGNNAVRPIVVEVGAPD